MVMAGAKGRAQTDRYSIAGLLISFVAVGVVHYRHKYSNKVLFAEIPVLNPSIKFLGPISLYFWGLSPD